MDTSLSIAAVDVTKLLVRPPLEGALGIAGLLGALDAATDLMHTDPEELGLRDELTAAALREFLQERRPLQTPVGGAG